MAIIGDPRNINGINNEWTDYVSAITTSGSASSPPTRTGSTITAFPPGPHVSYYPDLEGIKVVYSVDGDHILEELFVREDGENDDKFFSRIKVEVTAKMIELRVNFDIAEKLRNSIDFTK